MMSFCPRGLSNLQDCHHLNAHTPCLLSCIAGGGYAWLFGLVWTYVGAAAVILYLALAFARRCTLIEQPAIQILRNLHHSMSASCSQTPRKLQESQLTLAQSQGSASAHSAQQQRRSLYQLPCP